MIQRMKLLDAVSVNGASNPMFVADYKDTIFDIFTSGGTTAVIKFVMSNEDTVDFNTASVLGNEWKTIHTITVEDGTGLQGDTGIVLSGVDMDRAQEANISGARWVGVIVSGWSAGAITVHGTAINNDK